MNKINRMGIRHKGRTSCMTKGAVRPWRTGPVATVKQQTNVHTTADGRRTKTKSHHAVSRDTACVIGARKKFGELLRMLRRTATAQGCQVLRDDKKRRLERTQIVSQMTWDC